MPGYCHHAFQTEAVCGTCADLQVLISRSRTVETRLKYAEFLVFHKSAHISANKESFHKIFCQMIVHGYRVNLKKNN